MTLVWSSDIFIQHLQVFSILMSISISSSLRCGLYAPSGVYLAWDWGLMPAHCQLSIRSIVVTLMTASMLYWRSGWEGLTHHPPGRLCFLLCPQRQWILKCWLENWELNTVLMLVFLPVIDHNLPVHFIHSTKCILSMYHDVFSQMSPIVHICVKYIHLICKGIKPKSWPTCCIESDVGIGQPSPTHH